MATDRRDYSIGASQEAQANFNRVAAQLETLIAARNQDVEKLMADFAADGVADEFRTKEQRWKAAAEEVRNIIDTLRGSMEKNDETAQQTLSRARSAMQAIG